MRHMAEVTNAGNLGSREATLDSLLLPGTPAAVLEMYYGLEEQARNTDFGLLEEDMVVLDTETTGLSFKKCELIQIAAARISGRQVVDRFETFVNPSGPIPPEIKVLTHITDLDVRDAPSAEEAVAALADFVGGDPVLAHNATFDRTFIEKVPGGHEVSDNWIDTLALSRIALPRLKSHRLAGMAHAFHCDSVTHRADADVEALCGMWRIILCGLSNLPHGLLARLADMHQEVDWSFRPIFAHLAYEQADSAFSLKQVRHDLVSQEKHPRRMDASELDGPMDAPSRADIADAFSSNGIVGRMYDNYEQRAEQLDMALEVRDALATSTHRAIEAGTGVGKSMAYLVPGIEFAQRNGITVGIATKTNALTDQLVTHELPALARVLPGGVSFYSLKGYDHYPCLLRLERSAENDLPVALVDGPAHSDNTVENDMLTALAVTYAFSCQSPEGDLDALGIRWRFVPRQMLTTTPAECLRSRCPYYPNECFVHGARHRAACGDVVVTNHSLLLRSIAADNAILPPIRHWIIDEAHSFEDEARRQWAVEVSGETARNAFEVLGGVKSGAIHSLMTKVSGTEGDTLILGLLAKSAGAVSRASLASSTLFEAIHTLVHLADGNGGYDNITLWIDEGARSTPEWAAVQEAGTNAVDKLDAAVKALQEAQEAIAKGSQQLAGELGEATRGLEDLLSGVRLITQERDECYVYSAQLFRQSKKIAQEKLVAEKLDVGSDLAERWLPEMKSVVFTSATMAVGKSFEHFDHAVGLDALPKEDHKEVQLDSSFDFDSNMSVVVARDMPAPTDRDYINALEDLLYDVHEAMHGSVLTLFTNRREMERVYADLQPRLAAAGLDVVCQERGASARRLSERFVNEKELSLFALKSFWEGFDASGDTLRCVVIPRLPFDSPRDPLVRERDLREDRSWWKYSLPEAVLSVKQAAGRLIRTSTDTGVLVLADSRLVSKRYGRQFTNSLPSHNCINLERRNVKRYIVTWRKGRGGR